MPLPPESRQSRYGAAVPWWRRPLSLAIAVAINLLILWMLLRLAPGLPGAGRGEGRLTTFNVAAEQQAAAKEAAQQPQRRQQARTQPKAPPVPTPLPPPIVPPPPSALKGVIPLSRQEYAAADVSTLPAAQGQATADAGGAGAPGDSEVVGKGRNGEPLYAAEWYREPTGAEIGGYLPKSGVQRGAWALIACQTVARFHVDNCEPLGDSPLGSHLANAMVQAAWQFLVRPPRVGGKSLVGTWVQIRIEWNREAGK